MAVNWTIQNNQVVVTVRLPDGHIVSLTKKQAATLGSEINSAVRTAPTRNSS